MNIRASFAFLGLALLVGAVLVAPTADAATISANMDLSAFSGRNVFSSDAPNCKEDLGSIKNVGSSSISWEVPLPYPTNCGFSCTYDPRYFIFNATSRGISCSTLQVNPDGTGLAQTNPASTTATGNQILDPGPITVAGGYMFGGCFIGAGSTLISVQY